MDREIEGRGTADYLWDVKQVVPFLKVDKGLADEADGVQVMKPMPGLDDLLAAGRRQGRVRHQDALGHQAGRRRPASKAIVDQQFEVGRQILGAGLVPIIEPEVDINSPPKAEAEELLKAAILDQLDQLAPDQQVMLKLTLPEHGRLLRRPRRAPEGAAGRRALRRLQPRRGERPPRAQPRGGRQLLARPHRGPLGPAERRRVRRDARRVDREIFEASSHLADHRAAPRHCSDPGPDAAGDGQIIDAKSVFDGFATRPIRTPARRSAPSRRGQASWSPACRVSCRRRRRGR